MSRDPSYSPAPESLDRLFRLSVDLQCIAGEDGYFKRVNQAFTTILGWKEDELLARPLAEFQHPDDPQSMLQAVDPSAGGGSFVEVQARFRTKSGGHRWIEWSGTGSDDGLIFAVGRDVTERRRLDVLLAETQRAARVGGWEFDFGTEELYWTDETYRLHETTRDEFEPTLKSAIGFYTPESRPVIAEAVQRARKTGEGYNLDLQVITLKNNLIDVRSVGVVQDDGNGSARAYGSIQDISKLKSAEREQHEANALLVAAIEQSPAGIVVADAPDGIIRIANSAALGIRGGDSRHLTQIPIERHPQQWQISRGDGTPFKPEDLPLSRAILAGETTRDVELIIRRSDGADRWVLASAAPVRDEAGVVVAGVVVFPDITERKLAEQSEQRLQRIIESTTDFVATFDLEGRPIDLNPALRELLQIGAEAAIPFEEMAVIHPLWAYERVVSEGIPTAIAEGVWSGESALSTPDGLEVAVSQVVLSHLNERGEIEFFSTVMRDLTERKELQARLLHAQKMEGIGRLAGGIAHDFNNLLTVILGNVDLLDGDATDTARCADLIRQSGEQASRLTSQLLAFARKQVIQPTLLNLNERIVEFAKLLTLLLGEEVDTCLDLATETLTIKVDPSQLEQVVMNLAVNAGDAMPSGGQLTISTRSVSTEEEGLPDARLVEPGDYVELTMSDTGVGIPEEILEHLFEPFFTTKEFGKGTGLGLATSHGIVEQHGGHIFVESSVGSGTTFRIYFPRVREAASDAQASARGEPPVGTETLLLVEDEEMVRDIATQILTRLGYTVFPARDAAEAFALYRQHAGEIHGLVMDVVLPGQNGPEVVEQLRQEHGPLRVLYMSGYAVDEAVPDARSPESHFLQKPYSRDSLARAVRAMLDA